jgi:UDP:flavonoid glycosyltransferase YjiC (YdhE family)
VRVLVSTTAGAGHFGPLVPFARACADAGHDVAVAAPASFADEVRKAGFEHHPFADVPPEQMAPVLARIPTVPYEEANRIVVGEVFGRLDAQAALPGVVDIIDAWHPDVVLREICEFGSLAAALAAGVPLVEVAISVSAMTDFIVPAVERPLAELDALAGLPEGTAVDAMLSTPVLTVVPSVLDDALRVGASRAGVHRFHDATLSPREGSLPRPWGDPAHPLVYATFGSVAGGLSGFDRLYPDLVAAFADRPVRVLLTTGSGFDPAVLGELPGDVRVERWWPQPEVMPHCAAMVGHGGFGTTMTGLGAGVPQVVFPLFAFDQRINADHVAAVGAGIRVDGGAEAMAEVTDAVDRLLRDPSYAAAARAVADEMSHLPPVADAVDLLERLAAF